MGSDPTIAGPVLFAYDGSDLAQFAIEQAALQLVGGREALVLCVWQPSDVGFVPVGGQHFDAQCAPEVEQAAQETAAHGAELADHAGFRAQSLTVEMAPTWKGIVSAAEEHHASLMVFGTHHRKGIIGHLQGSVTAAVLAHSAIPALVVQQQT
jgi:nucleotide-binding universal stress UspA family protein